MRPLRVTRFLQEPGHCSIAACASVANYQNRDVDYDVSKALCQKYVLENTKEGLYSAHIALLLNHLGFRKVDLITSDITIFDYSWKKLSKSKLRECLLNYSKKQDGEDYLKEQTKLLADFLGLKKRKNNIVIDYRFSKYLKKALDEGFPAVVSFNWTMYFEFAKENDRGKPDPFGDYSEHAVVARGYSDKYIHIVDSHWKFYKYKLSKYREGYYLMRWEDFLTCAGMGDIIIPREYDPALMSEI